MAEIPSIFAPAPPPLDPRLLAPRGVIAPPGAPPAAFTIPGITPRVAPSALAPKMPGPVIAPPTAPDATRSAIAAPTAAQRTSIGPIMPPGVLTPPDAMANGPKLADLINPRRIEMGAPPNAAPPSGQAAVDHAKAAEAAIQAPEYHGKLGVLEKIGDAASRLLAPGIERRLGIGTIGYEDRLANAQAQTDRAEKELAEGATNEKAQADARLANAEATKDSAPPTTNAADFQVENTANGLVRINKLTGDATPLTVNGEPLHAPPPGTAIHIEPTDQGLMLVSPDGSVTPLKLNGETLSPPPPKATGISPEVDAQVTAQVGPKPDPKTFALGAKDPAYLAALDKWGKAVENIKNQEAQASGAAHGEGYNESRPVAIIDANGNLRYVTAKDAEQLGFAPASQGVAAMSRQAQINDIVQGSEDLKAAMSEPGAVTFSPAQTARLSFALREPNDGAIRDAMTGLFASGLTPPQQDFVASLLSLQERAMALRNIAGMGQGSDQLRRAIIKALPNITSGNLQLANKQLEAFDRVVANLSAGIPGVGKGGQSNPKSAQGATAGASGFTPGDKRTYNGATYVFKGGDPTQQANWEKQ